ncbi:MAG TPA: class I SAM-dependent methyltransferase [Terriglobales bacterium]|nr:class I SAM-dependent methyltransferase [Terriglobales bacterium]
MALLNRHGGLRRTVQEHGIARLLDGALREIWESMGMRILHLLRRGPRQAYSWLDALFSPTCDYWVRYTGVISALDRAVPANLQKVIEVSSGGRGGLAWALPGTTLDICLVDWSTQLLSDTRGGNAWRVCADACELPFADNSFDAAVSLDTVEHLSRRLREPFIKELQRVAKATVVITCPLQSSDGIFQGQDFDLGLHSQIKNRDGVQPGWLQEHIEQGHPTTEELSQLLPGAQITGSENCATWLRFASFYQRPFLWPLAGFFYLAFLRRHDNLPPYRRGLLVWQKSLSEQNNAEAIRPDLTLA